MIVMLFAGPNPHEGGLGTGIFLDIMGMKYLSVVQVDLS